MHIDTIAAISTPPGRGAIGVVRLSGPDALPTALRTWRRGAAKSRSREVVKSKEVERIVPPPQSHDITTSRHHDTPIYPRHAYFGMLIDPLSGETIDDGILTYFRSPHSYTGEDVVEISLHGNPLILEKAVALLVGAGAKPAQPGEFTRRAFLNGRMSLTEAEGVAETIAASTEAGLRAARRLREGVLEERVAAFRNRLVKILAEVEAVIDFAEEEDVQERAMSDAGDRLRAIRTDLAGLLDGYAESRRLKEGVVMLLTGEPNVGKSSLMNRLAGHEVSIVHAAAGTTRDVVREWVEVEGFPVDVHDSAGLRGPQGAYMEVLPPKLTGEARTASQYFAQGEVETQGVARSLDLVGRADLVVWVLDASLDRGVQSESQFKRWIGQANGAVERSLFVLNKTDLKPTADLSWLPAGEAGVVRVSARTGTGLEELRSAIRERLSSRSASHEELILLRSRHAYSLRAGLEKVMGAQAALENGEPPDLVALHLREAVRALDEVTGAIGTEDVLDRIFQDFCVGK